MSKKEGTTKITALRNTRCQGKPLTKGKDYEVPNRDATYLINIGKAEPFDAEAKKKKASQKTEPKKTEKKD